MFHYSPSSRSHGYTSYLPRRSYFPASFDIDEAPSAAYPLEDLGYPSLPHSFLPPRIDAETRYRRALYELEAAEQEYQAHISLERARQTAAIRQRAAAEALRREREIALFTEMERIERARALQEQVEERVAGRHRGLGSQVAFDRAHCGRHAHTRAFYGDGERDSVTLGRRARPHPDKETLTMGDLLGLFDGVRPECQRASPREGPTPSTRLQPEVETSTIGDLLGLFAGVHPQRERASPPERPTPPTSSQPHQPASRETQPQTPDHGNEEVNLSNILEFFHSIAAQARAAAGGEHSTPEQASSSQSEATVVDGKGKGKAKAEPVPGRTLFEPLFREHASGAHDQELRDLEYAIKLSLQDRDAMKAHASKASQSSPSASSSKVKVEGASSSSRAASPTRNATSPSVSAAVLEPVSALTSIRAVRTQFSALESGFKFPPVLDLDHSELAVTSNNAPVRAYESALNGLLERLDAIESDGNEEVRDVRREVVREVERALEEVERKVKEQAARSSVPEVTKQEASGVESEDASASATETVQPAIVHVTEATKPSPPNVAPVAPQAEADIDVAISGEYESGSPVTSPSEVVVGEGESAGEAAPANGDGDTKAVSGSEDASDSIATITPAPVAPAVRVGSSSNESGSTPAPAAETFLTSLSHDQFTFPPRRAYSQSSTNSGLSHDDDAVVVDNSSEGESVRSVDDEWATEF